MSPQQSAIDGRWATDFDGSPASARAARQFVVSRVERSGRYDLGPAAAAVTAELAANAVLHTRGPFRAAVAQTSRGVRIEVSDYGNREVPTPVPMSGSAVDVTAESATGRGLQVVVSLAARWGVELAAESKTVWVEIESERPSEAASDPIVTGLGRSTAAPGRPVRLLNMPVRAAVASGVQVDELVREFQLGLFDDAVAADERERFYALLDSSAPARFAGRRAALAAASADEDRFDVELSVDDEMISAVVAFRGLLEQLPARATDSMALPTPDVVAYRQWVGAEVTAQLAGATPTACPLP